MQSGNTSSVKPAKPMSKDSGNFNFNSVLLMIVLALSGWTLKTVTDQGNSLSALAVQVQNLERVVYSK